MGWGWKETIVAYEGSMSEFHLVEFPDRSKDITVNQINFLKECNELYAD